MTANFDKVAAPDRAYTNRISVAPWSSPQARADALSALALAQVGTAGTDRRAWVAALAEGTIRRVVPMALDAAAEVHPEQSHRAALRAAADRCRREGTKDSAMAARAAATDADAARRTAARRTADAADRAAYAARAARAAAMTAADADAAAVAAAYAANAAVYAARDAILRESVQVALDAYAMEGR